MSTLFSAERRYERAPISQHLQQPTLVGRAMVARNIVKSVIEKVSQDAAEAERARNVVGYARIQSQYDKEYEEAIRRRTYRPLFGATIEGRAFDFFDWEMDADLAVTPEEIQAKKDEAARLAHLSEEEVKRRHKTFRIIKNSIDSIGTDIS